jgi:hypothetical protein
VLVDTTFDDPTEVIKTIELAAEEQLGVQIPDSHFFLLQLCFSLHGRPLEPPLVQSLDVASLDWLQVSHTGSHSPCHQDCSRVALLSFNEHGIRREMDELDVVEVDKTTEKQYRIDAMCQWAHRLRRGREKHRVHGLAGNLARGAVSGAKRLGRNAAAGAKSAADVIADVGKGIAGGGATRKATAAHEFDPHEIDYPNGPDLLAALEAAMDLTGLSSTALCLSVPSCSGGGFRDRAALPRSSIADLCMMPDLDRFLCRYRWDLCPCRVSSKTRALCTFAAHRAPTCGFNSSASSHRLLGRRPRLLPLSQRRRAKV